MALELRLHPRLHPGRRNWWAFPRAMVADAKEASLRRAAIGVVDRAALESCAIDVPVNTLRACPSSTSTSRPSPMCHPAPRRRANAGHREV